MNFWGYTLYWFLIVTLKPIFWAVYRIKAINLDNIPKSGGVLLVGNHSSWFDTLFLTYVLKRPLWFFTGEFIFNVPIMGSLVKQLCVIQVKKNNSEEAIKSTVEKLNQGYQICIFPEGQLTKDGQLQRFRNGVSKIIKQSNATVIPFFIKGAYKSWGHGQKKPKFFQKITVKFGEKFTTTSSNDNEIANELHCEVKKLI